MLLRDKASLQYADPVIGINSDPEYGSLPVVNHLFVCLFVSFFLSLFVSFFFSFFEVHIDTLFDVKYGSSENNAILHRVNIHHEIIVWYRFSTDF